VIKGIFGYRKVPPWPSLEYQQAIYLGGANNLFGVKRELPRLIAAFLEHHKTEKCTIFRPALTRMRIHQAGAVEKMRGMLGRSSPTSAN
jgi:hypothetical protein|tara:strand:- start:551 stop:817 length:267 start_codon:yes stop_codon:yes gene_type:complete